MRLGTWFKNLFSTRNVAIDPWYYLFRPNNVATGEFLTDQDALKVSTVFACVRILAQGVSTLPAVLYDNLPNGGKKRAIEHPYFNLFRYKPNSYQDSVQFYEQVMMALVLRGNQVLQKVRMANGMVQQLIPLQPDYLKITAKLGEITYQYKEPLMQETRIFTADQVVHIRALSKNGIEGLSPIDLAMEAVGMSLATEKFGAKFFANGTSPTGVLEYPGTLTPEAYNRLKDDFHKRKSGLENANSALILEGGMKWQSISLTNEQSQFILTRKFQVEEICRWFGVQPHKVGFLEKASFANIEQQALEFVTDTLRPWLVRIEMALLTQLFNEDDWPKFTLEFLADALLRGDTKSRFEAHAVALNNGIKNIDEVRSQENLNPLPDELGQDFIRPLNMAVIGEPMDNGSEPGNETEPKDPTDTSAIDPQTGDSSEEDTTGDLSGGAADRKIQNAMSFAIEAEIGRVIRRAEKIRSNNKPNWVRFIFDSEKDIEPIIRSLFVLCNRDPNSVQLSSALLADKIIDLIKDSPEQINRSWPQFVFDQIMELPQQGA